MGSLFVDSQVEVDSDANAQSFINEPGTDSVTFTASTNQISHLADMFSTIASFNNQALMIIRPNAIVVYTEYNHIMNFQINMDPSLFQFYNFYVKGNTDLNSQNEFLGDLRLGIDINLISESFISACASLNNKKPWKPPNSITGSENITCYLRYSGDGSPFIVEFEDNLMTERLEFSTFYLDMTYPYDDDTNDEIYNLLINHDKIQLELLLKSNIFSNLLQDLLQINTTELYIYASNKKRDIRDSTSELARSSSSANTTHKQLFFISKGPIGHSKLIFPNEKTILEKLHISAVGRSNVSGSNEMTASVLSCYDFSNFIKILKAVKFSSRCKMIKDTNGVLSIQLLCKNNKMANYPGSLLTCNLLEIAPVSDLNVDGLRNEIVNIFEDDIYLQIYDASNLDTSNSKEKLRDDEPKISYAAFKRQQDEVQEAQSYLAKESSGNDTDRNNGQSGHVNKRKKKDGGAALEVPLFL